MKLLSSRIVPRWLRAPRYPRDVEAADGVDCFHIQCRSGIEEMRARTFATKEEGTLAWIRSAVRPGQVFCDVGANIGLYTLLAARAVGAAGTVYAFEPHVINCASLLANVEANRLVDRVHVFSSALNDAEGYFPFHYRSLEAGEACNQLLADGQTPCDGTANAKPATVELKHAVSLDGLISRGLVRPPHHIKIDVDGIELRILHGMRQLLSGPAAPESLQVELDPSFAADVHAYLGGFGYTRTLRHDTLHGKRCIAEGATPDSVAHNVVFRKA